MKRVLRNGLLKQRGLWAPAVSTRRALGGMAESATAAPSPPLIPHFDHTPQPYTGPSAKEVLEKRKRFLNPSIFLYYKNPVCPFLICTSFSECCPV